MELIAGPLKDQKIHIMEEFNFEKVKKTMNLLDWTWGTQNDMHHPDINELKETASSLLDDVIKRNIYGGYCATGGFKASMDSMGILHLEFVVEDWDGATYG